MAQSFVKQKFDYLKEAKKNIQSQPWAEPVGIALGVTESICKGLSGFVPGLCILQGACKLGSVALNPAPSLHDLNRQTKDLSNEIKCIKTELQDVKSILAKTFEVVRDVRYKDGIEKIDSSFKTYLDGSNNISQTFCHLEGFIFEMQSIAEQSLNSGKILEYLQVMKANSNKVECQKMIEYVLLVKMKYLIMTSSFYIFKKDFNRVAIEYENFNDEYQEILELFKTEFDSILEPGRYPSAQSSMTEQTSKPRPLLPQNQHSNEKGKIPMIHKFIYLSI